MLNNIAPLKDLNDEAAAIQEFIESPISDNPEEIVERGNDLSVLIARTGKMLADADYHKDLAYKEAILKVEYESPKLSISMKNKLIDGYCIDQRHTIKTIDRLNKTATHQLDWLRTLVSKAKAERIASNGING